jgi:hypothetical protein
MIIFIVLSKDTIFVKKTDYRDDLEKNLKDEITYKNLEILL